MIHDYRHVYDFHFVARSACDILRGLAYLHHNRIVHLDLKPQNILIDEMFRLKICDFGEAHFLSSLERCGVGTITYAAPEILAEEDYDERADVFSFSIVLWEMIHRDFPYKVF